MKKYITSVNIVVLIFVLCTLVVLVSCEPVYCCEKESETEVEINTKNIKNIKNIFLNNPHNIYCKTLGTSDLYALDSNWSMSNQYFTNPEIEKAILIKNCETNTSLNL